MLELIRVETDITSGLYCIEICVDGCWVCVDTEYDSEYAHYMAEQLVKWRDQGCS